jgi:hypothetical protein
MVAALFGVYGNYGTLVGRDAGIALLVVLSGFKVLECKGSRDFYIACFLGYFLIITNFIYTQTIPTAIFMFAVIIIITVSLITYNDTGKQFLIIPRLRLSGTLLLQASCQVFGPNTHACPALLAWSGTLVQRWPQVD